MKLRNLRVDADHVGVLVCVLLLQLFFLHVELRQLELDILHHRRLHAGLEQDIGPQIGGLQLGYLESRQREASKHQVAGAINPFCQHEFAIAGVARIVLWKRTKL